MTDADEVPTIPLNGEVALPLVGFGTWRLHGRKAYDAVRRALELGYRHIDTATMYGNEAEVGRALRDSGLDRADVFVTTKLPSGGAGRERETIDASLRELGIDRLDLWLVHWPPGGARPATWQRFLEARDAGKARAVGVSNYHLGQLDELIRATGEAPAVNQIPWSPYGHDARLLAAHRERGIAVEGYSPLKDTNLRDPVLTEIAASHGVTPAQVVLRWHVQRGIVVIPKSAKRDRIAANFDLFGFSLSPDDIARVDALTRR